MNTIFPFDKQPNQKLTNQQYLKKAAAVVVKIVEKYLNHSSYEEAQLSTKFLEGELSQQLAQFKSKSRNYQNLALDCLRSSFKLSQTEVLILLLCVARELFPSFKRFCADYHGFQNQNRPTLSMIGSLFTDFDYYSTLESSPLFAWKLIEIEDTEHLTYSSSIRIDLPILQYLLGTNYFDGRIKTMARHLPLRISKSSSSQFNTQPVSDTQSSNLNQITTLYKRAIAEQYGAVVQLTGTDITNKESLVTAASSELGCSILELSYFTIPVNSDSLEKLELRLRRWSILSPSLIFCQADKLRSEDYERVQAIEHLINNLQLPVIISTIEPRDWGISNSLKIELKLPDSRDQVSLWRKYLDLDRRETPQLAVDLQKLVSQFNLSASSIQAIASRVDSSNSQSIAPSEIFNALWHECRVTARQKLDGLATRVTSKASWDNLILPSATKQQLASIVSQVSQRAKVYTQWGFSSNRGSGITALFSGTSGTGKTTAAEVIANELKLDLYKIELSTVISKYIGETEKNLRKIFDAAEAGGAILLFDEADALFGKRTEVKDSKDRHSNAEISYLLQKMEAYRGLAILTTNIEEAIDSAFKRRLRFAIKFDFPDFTARERIWRSVFPSIAPTDGLDYEILAEMELSGGNIRSIALNAAFTAADEGEPIQMKHIVSAAKTEAHKLGTSTYEIEMMMAKLERNRENANNNSSLFAKATAAEENRELSFAIDTESIDASVEEISTSSSSKAREIVNQPFTHKGKYAHLSIEQIIELSRCYFTSGDYQTGYTIIKEGLVTYPNSCSLNFGLGEVAYEKKLRVAPQEILIAFERAEKGTGEWFYNDEGVALSWYWQAFIRKQYKIGDYKTMRQLYAKYIQAQPEGKYIEQAKSDYEWCKSQELFPGIDG